MRQNSAKISHFVMLILIVIIINTTDLFSYYLKYEIIRDVADHPIVQLYLIKDPDAIEIIFEIKYQKFVLSINLNGKHTSEYLVEHALFLES